MRNNFELKRKIEDLTDSGSISLPGDLVKAPVHQVSVREDTLEPDEPQAPDNKIPDSTEEWTVFKSKCVKGVESVPTSLR